MPAILKDLQAKFAVQMNEYQTLAGKDDLSGDDEARLDTMLTDAKSTKAAIERAKEQIDLAEWGSSSAGALPLAAAKSGRPEFEGFSPAGYSDDEEGEGLYSSAQMKATSTRDYRRSFNEYVRSAGLAGMKSASIKTLQEGADTSGGFLVPPDILSRVVAKEPAPTSVQTRVTTMNTGRDVLVLPKVNYSTDDIYTTGMRITWTGENPAASTTARVTDPIFGQIRIPIHTAMMSLPITMDLIEDANFDLLGWVSSKFAETRDLLVDNMIVSGTGVGQPYGILTNPGGTAQPAVVKSGVSATFVADTLMQAAYALPPQYDQNAAWVMEKTQSLLAVSQLKDGVGRYLYGMGTQESGLSVAIRGRQLIGYDVLLNQFMPTPAASSYSAIFGDLRGYYLVNRVGLSIQVLRELYAETNQVLVLGRIRFGGQVAEDWKLKIVQLSA